MAGMITLSVGLLRAVLDTMQVYATITLHPEGLQCYQFDGICCTELKISAEALAPYQAFPESLVIPVELIRGALKGCKPDDLCCLDLAVNKGTMRVFKAGKATGGRTLDFAMIVPREYDNELTKTCSLPPLPYDQYVYVTVHSDQVMSALDGARSTKSKYENHVILTISPEGLKVVHKNDTFTYTDTVEGTGASRIISSVYNVDYVGRIESLCKMDNVILQIGLLSSNAEHLSHAEIQLCPLVCKGTASQITFTHIVSPIILNA